MSDKTHRIMINPESNPNSYLRLVMCYVTRMKITSMPMFWLNSETMDMGIKMHNLNSESVSKVWQIGRTSSQLANAMSIVGLFTHIGCVSAAFVLSRNSTFRKYAFLLDWFLPDILNRKSAASAQKNNSCDSNVLYLIVTQILPIYINTRIFQLNRALIYTTARRLTISGSTYVNTVAKYGKMFLNSLHNVWIL